MSANDIIGVMVVFGYIFAIALAILWFLLPFAVFGIKDKLSELISEAKQSNIHLSKLRSEIASLKSGNSMNH